MRSYIGITDFSSAQQVADMLQVLHAHRRAGSERQLHVGVMMSYKTLHGLPSEWENVFPPKESLAEIFSASDALNCLHFADYASHPDLSGSLALAQSFCGPNLQAIQLDMTWPDPVEIEKWLCENTQPIEVILQVGRHALEGLKYDPCRLVQKLEMYEGFVHRVLLDGSMGEGILMNANVLLPCLDQISNRFPDMGLAVAGGLGPKTMGLINPIVAVYPHISIDAQGRLRPSGNAMHPIDWSFAQAYLIKALARLP